MENEVKIRVRLTGKAYQLIEKVRRGEGTYDEDLRANYLDKLDRYPGMFLRLEGKGPPSQEGSRNSLLRQGYLEVYQDRQLDKDLEALKPFYSEPEVEDVLSELDDFEILEKGETLLRWLSQWKVITPPNDIIAEYLDKLKKGEEMPLWALEGLVRDGFVKRTKKASDGRFEVASAGEER